jgi:hypothetical protein
MVPDIVLELDQAAPHSPKMVIFLDAKYRVETQLNDAISSIHTYRDALMENLPNGEDRRVVGGGLLVVPRDMGDANSEGDWRLQSAPRVLFRRGYQDRFRLGALVLRPGMTTEDIANSLMGIVSQLR